MEDLGCWASIDRAAKSSYERRGRFIKMNALTAYLSNPKTKRVLSLKPGDKGFSLIELVVVVAVLAILAAIAIPAFTSISGKARASAAANTVAQIAKECAAKYADQGGTPQFVTPRLDGYNSFNTGAIAGGQAATAGTAGRATDCPTTSGGFSAVTSNPAEYPTFTYDVATGAKTCTATAGSNAVNRGCASGSW